MKTLKKLFIFCIFLLSFSAPSLFAQQITKFAVVDTAKVYQTYFKNTTAIRNYESKKAEFQGEIEKKTAELQKLHDQSLEAKKKNDSAALMRLESQINQKTEYLKEYANAKNLELETMKNNLQKNDAFYKQLYDKLGEIAESGGYSLILSLQQANGILWYSSTVDITDEVIAKLGL